MRGSIPPLDLDARSRNGRPLLCGHRGARAHAPENTMAGFALAAEMGADLIELDVRLTRDGALAVIHDATVNRTTNGTGRVADLTWDEVQALDAGIRFSAAFAGQRVPSLGEVLAWPWTGLPGRGNQGARAAVAGHGGAHRVHDP